MKMSSRARIRGSGLDGPKLLGKLVAPVVLETESWGSSHWYFRPFDQDTIVRVAVGGGISIEAVACHELRF